MQSFMALTSLNLQNQAWVTHVLVHRMFSTLSRMSCAHLTLTQLLCKSGYMRSSTKVRSRLKTRSFWSPYTPILDRKLTCCLGAIFLALTGVEFSANVVAMRHLRGPSRFPDSVFHQYSKLLSVVSSVKDISGMRNDSGYLSSQFIAGGDHGKGLVGATGSVPYSQHVGTNLSYDQRRKMITICFVVYVQWLSACFYSHCSRTSHG